MKKPNLLKLDIQFFAGSGIEEFDLEKFDKEFAEEVEETHEETNDEIVETEEENTDDISSDEESTEEAEEVKEVEDPQQNIHESDEEKRNRAFADLRRQAQENEKYAALIKRLADENGMTPDDIVAQYEESRLNKEAEEQGTSPEVLKRLRQLEEENSKVKEENFAQTYNRQIEETMSKYGLKEEDIASTFKYIHENGLTKDNKPSIRFEDAYRLANMDSLIEKTKEQTRQELLASKKKRQMEASIPNGEGNTQAQDDLLDSASREAKSIVADW